VICILVQIQEYFFFADGFSDEPDFIIVYQFNIVNYNIFFGRGLNFMSALYCVDAIASKVFCILFDVVIDDDLVTYSSVHQCFYDIIWNYWFNTSSYNNYSVS